MIAVVVKSPVCVNVDLALVSVEHFANFELFIKSPVVHDSCSQMITGGVILRIFKFFCNWNFSVSNSCKLTKHTAGVISQ